MQQKTQKFVTIFLITAGDKKQIEALKQVRFKEAMEQARKNNLKVEFKEYYTGEEVASLLESFNDLSGELNDYITQYRDNDFWEGYKLVFMYGGELSKEHRFLVSLFATSVNGCFSDVEEHNCN